MTFSVEKDEGIRELGLDEADILEKVGMACIEYTGCPYECEISLTLTDDDRIRLMNRDMRGIDSATDVLSFPMLEFDSPGDFSGVGEAYADCFNPDTGELMLGDIVISTDHAAIQAMEYGHSVLREFSFLIAHSMLHLQGFDHIEPDDEEIMNKAQEEILNRLDIRR